MSASPPPERAVRRPRPEIAPVPIFLAALLAAGGCGDEAPAGDSDAFTARDSSGVRIVEVGWDRMPVLDSVDAGPAHVVGGRDGPPLAGVRDARLLPGGRVAVAHGPPPEVVVVDTAGGDPVTVAAAGEGPAELGSAASLHLEGDGARLGVYDPRRRRYAVFDLDGGLVGERSLRDVWPDRGGPAVSMWAPPAFLPVEDTSTFYFGARGDIPQDAGIDRARLPLLRVRGSRLDTVTRYPGDAFFRRGRELGPVLLGPTAEFAAAPGGIWIGDTSSPSVARWSAPGAPELVVRWRRALDRSLTEEDVSELVGRLMERIPESQRRAARRYAERPPVPDSLPAFGDLLVDERGVLWVGEHHGLDLARIRLLGDEPRSWALFAPDGTPRGRVVTPPRVDVLDVRSGWIVGLHQDTIGVETVRLYRVATDDER